MRPEPPPPALDSSPRGGLSLGSSLCRLTVKALRYYDDLDLLKPTVVDPYSGYRYYGLAQLREAGVIRLLRSLDMPLEDVREVVEAPGPEQAKEGSMEYEVRLKEMAAQPIAAVRMQCAPNEIGKVYGEALGRVFAHIGMAGVAPVGAPLAVYHRYDEEGVDMSVAVPVAGPVPEGDGVTAGELPAGLMAMTVHVGSYQTIGKAWEALTAWVQQHGHEQADPCYEAYLTDPSEEKDPAKYVTEVYCAIKS